MVEFLNQHAGASDILDRLLDNFSTPAALASTSTTAIPVTTPKKSAKK